MRNSVILLLSLGLSLLLSACEQPTLTAVQKKQGFCRSVVQASKAIMLDRQQGISQKQAIEHAGKVVDLKTRQMVLQFIDEAYQLPKTHDLASQEQAMNTFQNGKYECCMASD